MKLHVRLAWLLAVLACWTSFASAQPLPVAVSVADNVATVRIGTVSAPLADVVLSFDQATGLSAASLGVSAELVDITKPALLARLPNPTLNKLSSAFPVMLTVEPPTTGGLVQRRVTHIEIHTHALAYTTGSTLRLFKAPLSGTFRDITGEIAPGSVRTRGTTPGWSQFLVLADLRPSSDVIDEKFNYLRVQIGYAPVTERAPLTMLLDASEEALADNDFATAIAKLDAFRARVSQRAGTYIPDTWRATRDTRNVAGELLAGADTLGFSIGYLRDFGH
jgi:hypothetical protein